MISPPNNQPEESRYQTSTPPFKEESCVALRRHWATRVDGVEQQLGELSEELQKFRDQITEHEQAIAWMTSTTQNARPQGGYAEILSNWTKSLAETEKNLRILRERMKESQDDIESCECAIGLMKGKADSVDKGPRKGLET